MLSIFPTLNAQTRVQCYLTEVANAVTSGSEGLSERESPHYCERNQSTHRRHDFVEIHKKRFLIFLR